MNPAAPAAPLRIVVLGLSMTSSWANGHATVYRALVSALRRRFGARPVALYGAAEPEPERAVPRRHRWDLGFLGAYAEDRQAGLDRLLFEPARRRPAMSFAVAGAQFPAALAWPDNVVHVEHLAPPAHGAFYRNQRAALSVTRHDVAGAGWSPSIRLFEAAACGVPVISDRWPGIESFFRPGHEILLAETADDVTSLLDTADPAYLEAVGRAARRVVEDSHTPDHRAAVVEAIACGTAWEHLAVRAPA
jgi:spore maturation protein CgeB